MALAISVPSTKIACLCSILLLCCWEGVIFSALYWVNLSSGFRFKIVFYIIEHLVKIDQFLFMHTTTPDNNVVLRSINKFVKKDYDPIFIRRMDNGRLIIPLKSFAATYESPFQTSRSSSFWSTGRSTTSPVTGYQASRPLSPLHRIAVPGSRSGHR